jgi:hypothetical protein
LFVLLVELVMPFLYFAPQNLRLIGAGFTLLLQVLILLTGNYAFFNWLTIFLLIFLLDDNLLRSTLAMSGLPSRIPFPSTPSTTGVAWGWFVPAGLAIVLIVSGLAYILLRSSSKLSFMKPVMPLLDVTAAFKISNPYGLFAVMTTERPQIILEGSQDGENWLVYKFKYQPVDLDRPPPIVAPHQPRLDWQLWFAALRDFQRTQWFIRFTVRLLEGSSEVAGLLAENPFPEQPPKYIRALLYDYRFTDWKERQRTGNWWRRERLGFYMPPISIRNP